MTIIDQDQALAIAQEIFTALVDGGETTLAQAGDPGKYHPALHAYIDVQGATPLRVTLTGHAETATELARALMMYGPDDDVPSDEIADAYGELANIIGGNIKSLLPEGSHLGFPVVSGDPQATTPAADLRLHVSWRGRPLTLSIRPLP